MAMIKDLNSDIGILKEFFEIRKKLVDSYNDLYSFSRKYECGALFRLLTVDVRQAVEQILTLKSELYKIESLKIELLGPNIWNIENESEYGKSRIYK